MPESPNRRDESHEARSAVEAEGEATMRVDVHVAKSLAGRVLLPVLERLGLTEGEMQVRARTEAERAQVRMWVAFCQGLLHVHRVHHVLLQPHWPI